MKFNKLIPEISVKDLERSLKFYVNIIGFKIEYFREGNEFVFLSFEGSQIMIEKINDYWKTGELSYPFGRGINFQIEVKNIDSLKEKLKIVKYPLFKDIEENHYKQNEKVIKCKELLIQDPDGYLLRFSQTL